MDGLRKDCTVCAERIQIRQRSTPGCFKVHALEKKKGKTKTQSQQHPQRVDGGTAAWSADGGAEEAWGSRPPWAALHPHTTCCWCVSGARRAAWRLKGAKHSSCKVVSESPSAHTSLGHRKPQHLPFAFSLQAEATDVGNFRMSHLDAASLTGRKFGLESKAVPSSTSNLHVGQQEAMVGHQTSIGPCWAPTATCPTAFWPHTAPQ